MSVVTGQVNLGRVNLRQLMPITRPRIWPFYDTGGEILYYDDFSDGVLRGSQNDESGWVNGVMQGGITGITTIAPGDNGGRALHFRSPYSGGTFQDFNYGILLDYIPGSGSGTTGSTIMPIIGMECKLQMSGTSHYLGLSIERFDKFTGSTVRNKYEGRVEYKIPTLLWRQVTDITGSTGGQFNVNMFSQNLPINIGTSGLVQPQANNWVPVKLVIDLNKLVSGSTGNQSAAPPIGSFRCGSVYQVLPSGSTVYTYNQTPANGGNPVDDKYIKLELHLGNDTSGAWSDFYVKDFIITREPTI